MATIDWKIKLEGWCEKISKFAGNVRDVTYANMSTYNTEEKQICARLVCGTSFPTSDSHEINLVQNKIQYNKLHIQVRIYICWIHRTEIWVHNYIQDNKLHIQVRSYIHRIHRTEIWVHYRLVHGIRPCIYKTDTWIHHVPNSDAMVIPQKKVEPNILKGLLNTR